MNKLIEYQYKRLVKRANKAKKMIKELLEVDTCKEN